MYNKITKDIKLRLTCAFALLAMISTSVNAQTYYDGVRIGWEYGKQAFVNSGVYARAKKLANGDMALVYSAGASVYIKTMKSTDHYWGNAVEVSKDASGIYNYTNAELIELKNGTLMYAWNARPVSTDNPGGPYKIMAKYSDDGGTTWIDEQNIFSGGTAWREGCWEPSMLQLPSGELQIYFANEYNVPNDNQNISMMRSFDNGQTWSEHEVLCFRDGSRDGMPVPVCLQNNKGIVFAIEDNGFSGTFKPMIIYSSMANNWKAGTVSGTSSARWSALPSGEQLASGIYAGAPYLIQLSSGETLLSVQSGEGRETQGAEDHALMQVYVGNDQAKNFVCKSTPFPFTTNATPKVLWNSLCQNTDTTVMAISSISGLSQNNGIWTNTGRILHPMKSAIYQSGDKNWGANSSYMYIGAESQANATIKSMWDNDNVYFHFDIADRKICIADDGSYPWETDGIEIYLDPTLSGSTSLANGMYKFLINVNNVLYCSKSSGTTWNDWTPSITYEVKQPSTTNYTIDVTIPWSQIGEMPTNKQMAVFFKLHNYDKYTSTSYTYHENMPGGNPDKPNTWMRCTLDETTGISNTVASNSKIEFPDTVKKGESFTIKLADNTFKNAQSVNLYDATTGMLLQSVCPESEYCTMSAINDKGIVIVSVRNNDGTVSSKKLAIL